MASAATVEEIINYYVALLIIQYANKPKAQAHIALIISTLLADAVMLDVLNGYDLNTAVGAQLDVLGKYAGVNRYYLQVDLSNYFAFTNYADPSRDTEAKFGFSTYATYGGYEYNGTLQYSDLIETQNTLSDSDFRTLIKLAIIQNTSNHSHGAIDTAIAGLFGSSVRAESLGNMVMWYFVVGGFSNLIQAIITKGLFPKPMGVRLGIAGTSLQGTFGFMDYTGTPETFASGFSTYANYGSVSGQFMNYDAMA